MDHACRPSPQPQEPQQEEGGRDDALELSLALGRLPLVEVLVVEGDVGVWIMLADLLDVPAAGLVPVLGPVVPAGVPVYPRAARGVGGLGTGRGPGGLDAPRLTAHLPLF